MSEQILNLSNSLHVENLIATAVPEAPMKKPPVFQGGMAELERYFETNNCSLGKQASEADERSVSLRFIVNADGRVEHVKILKGLDFQTDFKAYQMLKAMPAWSAATQKGVAVPYYLFLNIVFPKGGEK